MIMHPNYGSNEISYDICLLKTEEISLSDDDKGLNSEKTSFISSYCQFNLRLRSPIKVLSAFQTIILAMLLQMMKMMRLTKL